MTRPVPTLLSMLVAPIEKGFIELRPIAPNGGGAGRSKWFPVTAHREAAAEAAALSPTFDCYFGVVPRLQHGGRGAEDVGPASAVWADLDTEAAIAASREFAIPPTARVRSGTGANEHAYWMLSRPHDADEVVALNKDLAALLGADRASTDKARILRLPGTLNHKTSPPREVQLLELSDVRVDFDDLRAAVPKVRSPVSLQRNEPEAPSKVSAAVARVVGLVEGAQQRDERWMALCPAHDDHTPSLSISEGEDGRCLVHCFAGCTQAAVVAAMGLEMADLFSTARSSGGSDSDATKLVRAALADGIELVHDDKQVPYVCVTRFGHVETLPLRGQEFEGWLQYRSYRERGKTASAQVLHDAVGTLAGMARFEGEEVLIALRVGGDRRRVVVDLGDTAWRAAEVTAEGWTILQEPDVRFRRPRTSKNLPEPVRGGSLNELRRFINVSDDSWPLVLGWLVAALSPTGPYPMLWLLGEQGTAKSTSAEFIRDLVDPVVAARRSSPRSDRDLMISASNCWVLMLDNLTKLSEEQSNALARLATGGGFATRQLYADAEEVVFDLSRPVVVTGIQVRGVREDLRERAINLELPVIEKGSRRREQEMRREYAEARPRMFGALLDAVSCAIRRQDDVVHDGTVRMADAAAWMTAAEPALGLPDGAIVAAFHHHQEAASAAELEADPTSRLLVGHLTAHGDFSGTHGTLLEALRDMASPVDREDLPGNAAKLSARLKEIAPALRARGVEMRSPKRGRSGTRLLVIEMDAERDARDARDD